MSKTDQYEHFPLVCKFVSDTFWEKNESSVLHWTVVDCLQVAMLFSVAEPEFRLPHTSSLAKLYNDYAAHYFGLENNDENK